MKLYTVYNGYMADTAIFVLVLAEDESKAAVLAGEVFKEAARNKSYRRDLKRAIRFKFKRPKKYLYPSSYWSELQVDSVFSELETEKASNVFE